MDFREKFNPSVQSISDVFSMNRYRIPSYQRGYSWEDDQVLDLWEDLMEVVDGARDSHFFGQLVTFDTEDSRQEIIDGQQRITTSQLLLAVISKHANQIQNELFDNNNDTNRNLIGLITTITSALNNALDSGNRLTISKSSDESGVQDAFNNLLRNGLVINNPSSNKAINNMKNTYQKFDTKISGELKKMNLMEQAKRLSAIYDAFYNRFYVVKVLAPNRQDAFTIFQTLNSRGADLTASDIIKSHIISLMSVNNGEPNQSSGSESASSEWNIVDRTLGSDSKKINNFIRSYWGAKVAHVTENKLYRKVIKAINTQADAQEFLKETSDLVHLYKLLKDYGNRKEYKNPRINYILSILSKANFTLYYPIMLSLAHNKFSEDTILRVLYKIISIFVRYRLICNKTTNSLENGFSNVAIKIWNGELNNSDAIVADLNRYNVSDNEVNSSFTNCHKEGSSTGQKRWVLDYLLASIYEFTFEDVFKSDIEMYDTVFAKNDYVPMHINEEIEPEDLRNYLGNWVIIENTIYSNPSKKYNIQETVAMLEKSSLKSNKRLADQIKNNDYQWNLSDIENMQKELGKNVTSIWY